MFDTRLEVKYYFIFFPDAFVLIYKWNFDVKKKQSLCNEKRFKIKCEGFYFSVSFFVPQIFYLAYLFDVSPLYFFLYFH